MKVSIVINTFNRAVQLQDCLRSLLNLNYEDFEVLVVNGPSTDNTAEVCEKYSKRITYLTCKERNLSVSRNVGVGNAKGDIVAFIDDDAIVHPMWLDEILAKYSSDDIVGVGGFTIDHTGKNFQATGNLCDRLGNAHTVPSAISHEAFCFPFTPMFPSLLGTNSTFRLSALRAIGGFDETFAYLLDETDVCLRLIDAGGKVVYAPRALIHHRYAPSHLRSPDRVPTTLFFQARSKAYFAYRHGSAVLGEDAVAAEITKYRNDLRRDNRWLQENGRLNHSAEAMLNQDVALGVEEGRRLSRLPAPTNLQQVKSSERPFRSFRGDIKRGLRIALVTQGYPPSDTSGIARWSSHVATGLAARGHLVHVITKGPVAETIDIEEGVWVHRISSEGNFESASRSHHIDVPAQMVRWSSRVQAELRDIGWENLDIVSAPIWDAEGLIPLLEAPIPVVTSLHTTYKLALPFKPDWRRPLYAWNHVRKMIRAEKFIFDRCSYFLGNSQAVVEEINDAYAVDISKRTITVPHGVDLPVVASSAKNKLTTVLFVGRQECRKGFDTALKAAIHVCQDRDDVIFRFVGAATGDDVCEQVIRSYFEPLEAEFDGRIRIEGHLSELDLLAAYSSCDIFLVPSRFESFGLTAIEAMRFGKAVVAGNAGGLKEIIESKVNGMLVDPDDELAMAATINALLKDEKLRLRLGAAALSSYRKKFSIEKMVQGIEVAFISFIQNDNATSGN